MEKRLISVNDESVIELSRKDSTLKKLIHIIGNIEINMRPNFFMSLVRSIIGQQISVPAAEAVYQRLKTLVHDELTAEKVSHLTAEDLRGVGLSTPKIKYVHDLTNKILHGELKFNSLKDMDNHSAIKELTKVKGIGQWTAEMFLIFSLGRMNVLAIDDIGLQRGARWLYQVEKSERRKVLVDKKDSWYPHLSIASFYLWEIVHLKFDSLYPTVDDIIT